MAVVALVRDGRFESQALLDYNFRVLKGDRLHWIIVLSGCNCANISRIFWGHTCRCDRTDCASTRQIKRARLATQYGQEENVLLDIAISIVPVSDFRKTTHDAMAT